MFHPHDSDSRVEERHLYDSKNSSSSAANVYNTILAQPTHNLVGEPIEEARQKELFRAELAEEERRIEPMKHAYSPISEAFCQEEHVSTTGPREVSRQSYALQSPLSNESSPTRSVEREHRVVQPHEMRILGESSVGFDTIRVQTDVSIPCIGDVQYQSVGSHRVATQTRTRHNTNTWVEVPRKSPPPRPPSPPSVEYRDKNIYVEVEKIVHVDRPVEVVHVDRPVEVFVEVEKVVYREVDRPVVVYRDKIVEVEKIIHVDRPVIEYRDKIVERERIVHVDRPVEMENIKLVPYEVEKIVMKEVPVEKIVERIVEIPVTHIQVVPYEVEKIFYVQREEPPPTNILVQATDRRRREASWQEEPRPSVTEHSPPPRPGTQPLVLEPPAGQDQVRRQEAELREVSIKVAKAVAEVESARQEHAKAHSDAENARQEKVKALAAAEKVDQLEQQVGMLKAEVAHEKRERFGAEEKVGQLSEEVRGLQAVHQVPSAPAVQYQAPSPRPRPVRRTEFDAESTQHPRVPGETDASGYFARIAAHAHGTRSEGFASQNDAGGRSRRTEWMLGSTPPDVQAAGTFLTPSPRPRPVGSQQIIETQTIQVPRMTYDASVLEPKGLAPKYYEVPAGTGSGLRLGHRLSTARSPAASVTGAFFDQPGATGEASASFSSPPTESSETLRAFFESPNYRNRFAPPTSPVISFAESEHALPKNFPAQKRDKVGIGLLLGSTGKGMGLDVEVLEIIPGLSADESNQFDVGDVVLYVDGKLVQGMPLAQVKQLTIGEVGTTVTLIMRSLAEGRDYQVILTRKAPEFVGSQNKECVQTVYRVSEGEK